MRAGELRHRIQIQANTPTQGSLGAAVDAWATVWSRWAKIERLEGKRFQYAQQLKAEVTHLVTIRNDNSVYEVGHKHRILFGERVFTIDFVDEPEEWSTQLDIYCHEVRE